MTDLMAARQARVLPGDMWTRDGSATRWHVAEQSIDREHRGNALCGQIVFLTLEVWDLRHIWDTCPHCLRLAPVAGEVVRVGGRAG